MLNPITPTHLLVSCAHYKIACVEFSLGNSPSAKRHLETAREIGELRRRGEDDAHIARILWKRAEILAADPWEFHRGLNEGEVAAIREQAEQMRHRIEKDEAVRAGADEVTEWTYDRSVCGYFR